MKPPKGYPRHMFELSPIGKEHTFTIEDTLREAVDAAVLYGEMRNGEVTAEGVEIHVLRIAGPGEGGIPIYKCVRTLSIAQARKELDR